MKLCKKGSCIMLKNFAVIVAGTLILSFGTALFIIPFSLVTGGVSGLAIVISGIIDSPYVTRETIVTVTAWLLFFAGLLTLGKSFSLKTLVSTITYTVSVPLFSLLVSSDVMGGFFRLNSSQYGDVAVILAALFGGALVGTGCAVTFHAGGSTGGVDIIAFSICKIFKKLRSTHVIFFIDASIIIAGMFVTKDLALSLLGIVTALISVLVIDKLFLGESTAFIAQIISANHASINQRIIETLDRTTTIINAEGGYTHQNKKMLIFSFSPQEYAQLMSIITQEDSKAFVTIHRVHEISGEGWS